jgi:Ca-activated chloride channel family protein
MRSYRNLPHLLVLPFALTFTLAHAQTGSDSGPLLLDKATRVKPTANATTNYNADLKVNVNMTIVPVTVLDGMGRSVVGLGPYNFKLFDNAHPVEIASFARQDQPIAVGLVFDCSRSMMDKFKTEREAPRQLFNQLGGADESFLVTVSDRAQLKSPLTVDLDDISNSLMFTRPNGTTPLLDGIHMGLMELRKSHLGRKALVVVSDGGDNNSRYTLHEIDELAAESDTQIFTILLYNNPQAPEEVEGPDLLVHLAQKSGGVNYTIQKIDDIHAAMAKIGISLHNQYVLGYYTPDDGRSGQYRKIAVQLLVPKGTPRLSIHARAGYYAP